MVMILLLCLEFCLAADVGDDKSGTISAWQKMSSAPIVTGMDFIRWIKSRCIQYLAYTVLWVIFGGGGV